MAPFEIGKIQGEKKNLKAKNRKTSFLHTERFQVKWTHTWSHMGSVKLVGSIYLTACIQTDAAYTGY